MSWATTVRWRDCWDCIPPHRTLAALPPDGVVIALLVGREPQRPRRRVLHWPPRIRPAAIVAPIEGVPARFGTFEAFGALNGFDASLWVFFGRRHPTRAQLARAQTELRRARLPH
jgi:hypothetical protein